MGSRKKSFFKEKYLQGIPLSIENTCLESEPDFLKQKYLDKPLSVKRLLSYVFYLQGEKGLKKYIFF